MVASDGSFELFYSHHDAPELPRRLDARDTISFNASTTMTLQLELEKLKHRRSGCYARMASGQLFGRKGRICSDISTVKRLCWRIFSVFERNRKDENSNSKKEI